MADCQHKVPKPWKCVLVEREDGATTAVQACVAGIAPETVPVFHVHDQLVATRPAQRGDRRGVWTRAVDVDHEVFAGNSSKESKVLTKSRDERLLPVADPLEATPLFHRF